MNAIELIQGALNSGVSITRHSPDVLVSISADRISGVRFMGPGPKVNNEPLRDCYGYREEAD